MRAANFSLSVCTSEGEKEARSKTIEIPIKHSKTLQSAIDKLFVDVFTLSLSLSFSRLNFITLLLPCLEAR